MSDATKGSFCWYDLMTSDVEAGKAFYTKLIGWQIENFPNEQHEHYQMWKGPKGPLGGVMKLPEEARSMGAPPHWLAYVATDDLDRSLEQAKRLGGEVLTPAMDIPTVGKFAILRDPLQAVIALFMGQGEMPAQEANKEVGEVAWHELYTGDVDRATGFYGEMFGWSKMEDMDMGEMGVYRIFGRQGVPLGGMMKKPPEQPGPNAWLYYVQVADVKAKAKEAEALGAKLLNGPMEVPGGDLIAQFVDPQGAAFAIVGK